MSRMQSLKLGHGLPLAPAGTKYAGEYVVLVVKNTVHYVPGQFLSKDEVAGLCSMNSWDVTVVPYKENAS